MTLPHPHNACGGAYTDWLEVNLTDKCNGHCSWCVEKRGWHPTQHAPWQTLVDMALSTGRRNVILLGGEPTLHPHIREIITALQAAGRRAWVTTNGSNLEVCRDAYGVNISIHHYDMERNFDIVGVYPQLNHVSGIRGRVRFNCNCIRGYVDTKAEMRKYVSWAKATGAQSVRFAELKFADESFVSLAESPDYDPYCQGCSIDTVILGLPVNIRLMCGQQTIRRACPRNPTGFSKPVLYYDGLIYEGWQLMDPKLEAILEQVRLGVLTPADAAMAIEKLRPASASSSSCHY